MENNTRHRAGLSGFGTCICRNCCTTSGGYRRTVKRTVRRAVRHSERTEITRELFEHNDRDGDAAHLLHLCWLTITSVRNMR